MKQLGRILTRIIDGLTCLMGWIAALCLLSAALIVTEGVIVRKVLGISTIWQIEASVYLLIFVVFGGAAFVQKNEHTPFSQNPGNHPHCRFHHILYFDRDPCMVCMADVVGIRCWK